MRVEGDAYSGVSIERRNSSVQKLVHRAKRSISLLRTEEEEEEVKKNPGKKNSDSCGSSESGSVTIRVRPVASRLVGE